MQADIYVTLDSRSPQKTEKRYGYVLECQVNGAPVTREGFGSVKGTYHKATLRALCEAFRRFRQPCEITVHAEDEFVLSMMIQNLSAWAGNGFKNSSSQPIKNSTEWSVLWALLQGHQILIDPGSHTYSEWLSQEIKKRKEKEENT